MARVRLTQGTSTNQLAGVAESQQAGDAVEHTQIPTTGTVPASWDHIAPDAISDISAEWPSAFASGFDLTAGDIWRENGEAGQAYVYAGDDVTVTAANFSSLEPVDDNPIWRQIAGHSLFNWPATAPANPFTILHGTIWNGVSTDPGVFIWTGGDEEVTSSTYASFTPSTTTTVHDWRHLDGAGSGGTTVVAVTDGSTNSETTLTGLTIGGTDYNIPAAGGGGGGADNDDTVVPTWLAADISGYERGQLVHYMGEVYYLNDSTVGAAAPDSNSDWISVGPYSLPASVPTSTSTVTTAVGQANNTGSIDASGNITINTTAEVNVQADWNVTDTNSDAYINNKPTVPTSFAPTNAEQNVQADWNVTDTGSDAYIANKPTVPTTFAPTNAEQNVQSDWNVTDTGSDAYIANKPTVPTTFAPTNAEQNVQSDWDVTDTGSDAYIANKPTIPTNTNTTYDISAVDSGDDVNIRLTAGGSGSGTDDILVTAGTNITIDNVTDSGFRINSTATGTGTGGITQVSHDDTLNGRGTAGDPLGVSRLPIWQVNNTYDRTDIVIDEFDNQLYMTNVTRILPGGGVPIPGVRQAAFGSLTGFTDLRYIIEFTDFMAPAVDDSETYTFIIDGSGIDVTFTVDGDDIDGTRTAGFWVIDPDATGTSYTVTAGATPTVRSTGFTLDVQGSSGTGTPNARPGLDPDRWAVVSDTPIDYNARYSVAVGEVARWAEGTTELQGTVDQVLFEDVQAVNSTVTGTGADVRYTVSGLIASDVAAMVAADRVMLTSGAMPLRTIGIATQGSDPNTVVFQGTSLQSDSATISDPAIVGEVIRARGPIDFRASFAEVTLIPESQAPTNLVEDFHSVADTAARAALTTTDVKFGDVVFQQDDNTFWEVTHGTSPVGNFLNITWASATDGSGARELALHFSDTSTMPDSSAVYTVVAGADTWSFRGSRVTTRTAANMTIEWRVPDASVGGSANRTGLDRAATLTSADDTTVSFEQIIEETTVSLTEDNQTLTVTVDGVSASVQTRDIKFGSALPAVAHSVRGEVFATYTDGGQAIDLFIFNGTAWQLTDLTIDSLHVQGSSLFFEHPQIPGHTRTEITGTGNRNDAATVTDVRIQADVLRQELGHQVSPHGELEQEPGTSYRHVQGIELGGDFADDPNGTFRHARRVDRSVEYPTVAETADANTSTNNSVNSTFGQSFTPLQAGLFPSAPIRGLQGSVHDTFRLQQYHGTNAASELGLGGNSGLFMDHDFFMENGGLADATTDPSGSPVNAKYHITDGGLIDTVPATGLIQGLNSGFTLGMVFSPNEAEAVPQLVDTAFWSMDFGARNVSDSRNVGVFLEESPGSGTIPVLNPEDAEWLENGAFFDIRFASTQTPSSSQTIVYTLTFRDSTTYTFSSHDGNGNQIVTRSNNFGYFWRIPRSLITFSGGTPPTSGFFTGLALTRSSTDHYRIRVKQGTAFTGLLRDLNGVVELNPNNTYNLLSYVHLNRSSQRISISVRLFDWNIPNSRWDIRSSLGIQGTLEGYRVVDADTTPTDRLRLSRPTFNLGLSEYQNDASAYNNYLNMSKVFIARASSDPSIATLDALATSQSPFRGLIESAASSGYEIQDLPYVDIPYTAYDNATKTITPANNWLVPDVVANATEAQQLAFRNTLNADGSWTPVSESTAALGTFNGTTTNTNARIETVLPDQGAENISTTDVRQFWIHPTGSGYVDPVGASSSFSQMNPSTGAASSLTFSVPQGPIEGLTYFTTTGIDGASSPITFLNTPNTNGTSITNWDTSYFLGDGSAGTVRVYSMAPSTVSSVSHNLVSPGGTRRIYVPGFRDDYRTATTGISPLTAADLDANTHYFRGLFLDGMGRINYFQIVSVDTSTGLLSVIRVDNDVANSNDTLPTGRNIELPFGPGSENLDLQQFASFQFQAATPREQDSVVPLNFDPIGIFLGSMVTADIPELPTTDTEYFIPYSRRGVTYYWYPNKILSGQTGVFQSTEFTGTIPGTDQWIFSLIG